MKYIIEYKIGTRIIKTTRKGDSAPDAITKLTDQYKWSWRLSMVDSGNRGIQWCTGLIDTDGGINYNYFVVCKRCSDGSKANE